MELLNLCQENSALARTLLPTQPVTWIWANHGTMVEDEWTPSLDVLLKNNVHASRFTSRDGTLRGIQLPEQWTIDPTDGLHTLEKHCRSHDVNICRGIRANDVSIDPLGTVVCTNRGTIRADAVVFAAGAWTGELLDGFSDKVTPVREHVHLGVHEGVKTPQVIRAQNGYIQWRSSASGWAISGARWATPHLEMGEQDTSQTPEPISTALNQFRAHLTEHCPDPQAVQRYLWAKTCDGLPIIGPVPGRSTWVCCTGFMGNDWGFGIRAGKAVADGLLSGTAPGIPDWLTATRFL